MKHIIDLEYRDIQSFSLISLGNNVAGFIPRVGNGAISSRSNTLPFHLLDQGFDSTGNEPSIPSILKKLPVAK